MFNVRTASIIALGLVAACFASISHAMTFNLAGALADGQKVALEVVLDDETPDAVFPGSTEWYGSYSLEIGSLSLAGRGGLGIFDDSLIDGKTLDSIQFGVYDRFDMPYDGDQLQLVDFQGGFRIDPNLLPSATPAGVATIASALSDSGSNGGYWTIFGWSDVNGIVKVRDGEITSFSATPAPVPLPAAAWLFLSAIGGAGFIRRFKR